MALFRQRLRAAQRFGTWRGTAISVSAQDMVSQFGSETCGPLCVDSTDPFAIFIQEGRALRAGGGEPASHCHGRKDAFFLRFPIYSYDSPAPRSPRSPRRRLSVRHSGSAGSRKLTV